MLTPVCWRYELRWTTSDVLYDSQLVVGKQPVNAKESSCLLRRQRGGKNNAYAWESNVKHSILDSTHVSAMEPKLFRGYSTSVLLEQNIYVRPIGEFNLKVRLIVSHQNRTRTVWKAMKCWRQCVDATSFDGQHIWGKVFDSAQLSSGILRRNRFPCPLWSMDGLCHHLCDPH